MRNFILSIATIAIMYFYLQDHIFRKPSQSSGVTSKTIPYELKKKSDKKLTENELEIKDGIDEKFETKNEADKEFKVAGEEIKTVLEKEFAYKPDSFIERLTTNVFIDFLSSEQGSNVAKEIFDIKDSRLIGFNTVFRAENFNPNKKMYQIEKMTNSDGKTTICGQEIRLTYFLVSVKELAEGKELNDNIDKKVIEYKLGKHTVPEFNILPDGLKINEILRAKVHSPALIDFKRSKDDKKIMLSVDEHKTSYDFNPLDIKIFDEYVGGSKLVSCGDKIRLQYKINKADGSKISDGLLEIEVGDFSYPPVLSYIIPNMNFIGTRTVILPGDYLTKSDKPLIPIYTKDYVIMELSNVLLSPKKEGLVIDENN